jgi:hypothetical protein
VIGKEITRRTMMETVKKRFAKRVSATKLAAKKLLEPVTGKRKKVSESELLERIQSRAYDLFVQSGGAHGRDQENWYEAERLVRAELGQ